MRKFCLLIGLVLVLSATPVHASHWDGIKVTITNLDVPTKTSDIDITAYTSTTNTLSNLVKIGPFPYVAGAPIYPAIDWGDGSTVSTTSLTVIATGPPAAMRGSFSHSYGGVGPYTVRVASGCCGGGPTAETGNPVYETSAAHDPSYVRQFTNTVVVDFSSVPAASGLGLFLLAGALLAAGAILLLKR